MDVVVCSGYCAKKVPLQAITVNQVDLDFRVNGFSV